MKDVLKPYGSLDILGYYARVAPLLKNFLRNKEIATKTHLPKGVPFFLKRGSNSPSLFISDLKAVDEKMLELRAKHGLGEVKSQLDEKQILIWQYFVPRKFIQFFYATNGEKPGRDMDRVFIDIDRQNNTSDDARKVCLDLIKTIKQDKEFSKLLKFKIRILWTGSSFHVLLDLNKKINLNFYNTYLSYGKKKEKSFIMKWAAIVSKTTGLNVKAGHERERNALILDSSNTPSGKLARCPFSLHIDAKKLEIDGIAVPVSESQLADKKLVSRLRKLSPKLVLKDIKSYSGYL